MLQQPVLSQLSPPQREIQLASSSGLASSKLLCVAIRAAGVSLCREGRASARASEEAPGGGGRREEGGSHEVAERRREVERRGVVESIVAGVQGQG
jgi:hypothetical protein